MGGGTYPGVAHHLFLVDNKLSIAASELADGESPSTETGTEEKQQKNQGPAEVGGKKESSPGSPPQITQKNIRKKDNLEGLGVAAGEKQPPKTRVLSK